MRTWVFGLCCGLVACSARPSRVPSGPAVPFEARWLLAASDVDMVGTAYADGVLQPLDGVEDVLSIIEPSADQVHAVPASNSVVSWPAVLDVTPDGRFAVVVETREALPGVEEVDDAFEDFPPGSLLTVVDLQSEPNIVFQGGSGAVSPRSVSVHPVSGVLAMPSDTAVPEVVLLELDPSGVPGTPQSLPIPDGWLDLGPIEAAVWHPNEPVLALNFGNKAVAFGRVEAGQLRAVGDPVSPGGWLTAGEFVPGTDHFLIPDVGWGSTSLSYVTNGRGRLHSIHYDAGGAHVHTDSARVGISPEGFAISPDGAYAVTVNMRRTYLPDGFVTGSVRGRDSSSLSLLSILDDGRLELEGPEVRLEAILPEDAVFDVTGRTLAVTGYHGFEEMPQTGWVEVWTIVIEADGPELRPTGERWDVARGPHDLAVVP